MILLNEELLEHRIVAAIEQVDRRIMAVAAAVGEFDDLFDAANTRGRADYAAQIVQELKLRPWEQWGNAALAELRVALNKQLTAIIAEQLRRAQIERLL